MPMIQTAKAEEVQTDSRTRFAEDPHAEAGSRSPVQRPEAHSEFSGMAVDTAVGATEESRADRLRGELAGLESRFTALGEQLAEAVRRFQAATVPDGDLGTDLTALQEDFGAFRARVAGLAGSLSVPTESITGPALKLEALRQVLDGIDEAERRRAFRELQDRATSELKHALGLVYRDNPGFAPLEECKGGVRRLLAEITASEWPDLNSECRPLALRQHAVSRLIDLARDGARLSDEACEAAVEAVAASFGKPLAIAAVRGRLTLEEAAPTPTRAAERCPGCGAELDPGARFCGECGMKLG